MTVRIEVKNMDSVKSVRVLTREGSKIVDGRMNVVDPETKVVPPGASVELFLHSSRDVIVEEVQDAVSPGPSAP